MNDPDSPSASKKAKFSDICDAKRKKSWLKHIRQTMGKGKNSDPNIDDSSFEEILLLMESPCSDTLNLAFSIVANACLVAKYRDMFKQPNFVAIRTVLENQLKLLKEEDADDILICRAWRLVGNLAASQQLCNQMLDMSIFKISKDYLVVAESMSFETFSMLVRAIEKGFNECKARWRGQFSKGMSQPLSELLKSKNTLVVKKTLELFSLMAKELANSQPDIIWKPMASFVEERSGEFPEGLDVLARLVRSRNLEAPISFEGTRVLDVFNNHLLKTPKPSPEVLEAMCSVCDLSVVRSMLKHTGSLNIILDKGREVLQPVALFWALISFEYDDDARMIVIENKPFVDFLVDCSQRNYLPWTLCLWLAKASKDIPSFDANVLLALAAAEHKFCRRSSEQMIQIISGSEVYFQRMLLSGLVHEFAKWVNLAKCRPSRIREGVIVRHLESSMYRRTVSLALPFLKFLDDDFIAECLQRRDVISEIVASIRESPVREDAVAAIAEIGRCYVNFDKDEPMSPPDPGTGVFSYEWCNEENYKEVTFELDDGSVRVSKAFMCHISPVMLAMLRGNFVEAEKETIKFPQCKKRTFEDLISYIEDPSRGTSFEMEHLLETLTLIDRLMIPTIGEMIVENVLESVKSGRNLEEHWLPIYVWVAAAGPSIYAAAIRKGLVKLLMTNVNTLKAVLGITKAKDLVCDDIKKLLKFIISKLPEGPVSLSNVGVFNDPSKIRKLKRKNTDGFSEALTIMMISSFVLVTGLTGFLLAAHLPTLPRDIWWGKGEYRPINARLRNFTISVSQEMCTRSREMKKSWEPSIMVEKTMENPGESDPVLLTISPLVKDYFRSIDCMGLEASNVTIFDLNKRLLRFLRTPITPTLEGTKFQRGFNTDCLRDIIEYWMNNYNIKWREREKLLNTFPQYTTVVNGLRLHFIRARPEAAGGKKILPLLILHGWPGSVREFFDMIPMLTQPSLDGFDFVFDIIAPSLPGFGWSDGPSKPGMGPAEMSVVLNNLMERLGISKYYVQGGDWGSILARMLAQLYPKNVLGLHSNLCLSDSTQTQLTLVLGGLNPSQVVEQRFEHLMYPFRTHMERIMEDNGYFHLQATRPDTLGIALSDTPAGLAAYILEKFSIGTNRAFINKTDGGLTERYTMDSLLDNVMIYWLTGSITTSMRLYSEFLTPRQISYHLHDLPVLVPSACVRFHHDILWQSEKILRQKYHNLVHLSDVVDGGHFAAMELPGVLAQDIFIGIDKIRHSKYSTRFH